MTHTIYNMSVNPISVNRYLVSLLSISLFLLPDLLTAQQSDLPQKLNGEEWKTELLTDGVWWHSYHGNDYFDSMQSINLVEVDWQEADFSLAFGYSDSSFTRTSEFGEMEEALVSINGSFFDVQGGGSVVFFRVDGEIQARGAVNRRLYSESGGVVINNGTPPSIMMRPEDGWLNTVEPTILASGPLLVHEGDHRNLNNDAFNQNRHPRTAVAITSDDRMFLVTIDGRNSEAHGMSTPELREFLESLGAITALNLDGGGSTAMWIKDRGENGIVNYPSDNGRFDRNGERGVANALLLIPNQN